MADKLQEIIRSATRIFARHSYAKVTMEEVAASMNLVPGALYHYFKDKEELIFNCYMHGLDLYREEIKQAAEPGLDGLEMIRRLIRRRLTQNSERMILFTDIDALPREYSAKVHSRRWENAQELAEVIEIGQQEQSISDGDPLLISIAIISILDWTPFWLTDNDYYSRQEALDGLDDIITHGIFRRDLPKPSFPELPDLKPLLTEKANLGKRELKLDNLLRVATDNFNRKGALGASIEGIAADAGITRAGVYYHYKEKEGLLMACLKRGLDQEIASGLYIKKLFPKAIDYVVQCVRCLLMLHNSPCGPKATYHNINFLPEGEKHEFMSAVQKSINSDLDTYQHWINAGLFRNVDTYFAQRVITGMGHWYPIWFGNEHSYTPPDVADLFSQLFLFGLKPRQQ